MGAGDPSGAVFSPRSTFFIFLIYFFLEYQEAKDLKTREDLEAKIYFIIQIYFKNKIFFISFSYFFISLSYFKFD